MCYVNHTTKILVRFGMQLSQKGYNNAKPTRFKTTTQLLNIKCCPLRIKRKWGAQKMLESKTERPHLHNAV